MSYRIIGYENGRAIKVDERPAYGGSVKLGGSLVVGGPRPHDRNRVATTKRMAEWREAIREEKRS